MRFVRLALFLCPAWLAAADRFTPAPYEKQAIDGVLGERMRVNLEGRLLEVDEKAITEGFHKRPGSHPWIGEHAGRFLDAAVGTLRPSSVPGRRMSVLRQGRGAHFVHHADGQ